MDDPQWEDLNLPTRRFHARNIESKLWLNGMEWEKGGTLERSLGSGQNNTSLHIISSLKSMQTIGKIRHYDEHHSWASPLSAITSDNNMDLLSHAKIIVVSKLIRLGLDPIDHRACSQKAIVNELGITLRPWTGLT